MRPSSGIPTTCVPGEPAPRWRWSKATRRATRRAAALADELNVHSFRVHTDGTVTWTRMHVKPAQAKHRAKVNPTLSKATGSTIREPSERQKRSNERAAAHQVLMDKAQAFRARSIIRWWANASAGPPIDSGRDGTTVVAASADAAAGHATPYADGLAAEGAPEQQESMDDERAPKRRPPSSPAVASPTALRSAKQRVDSPLEQGLNPNAPTFLPNPSASSGRSAQPAAVWPLGEAAFTRTFSRPASSSTTSQNGSGSHNEDVRPSAAPRSLRWGFPGSTTMMAPSTGSNESG